jgi:hypothetical protein
MTEIIPLEVKPLEILVAYKLIFSNLRPLHFLPLLIGLALMIVFIYILLIFFALMIKSVLK